MAGLAATSGVDRRGVWAMVPMLQMHDLAGYILWVAVGSAAGGVARFAVSGLVARTLGETFPWGTMSVNVTGALAIGVLAGALDAGRLAGWTSIGPLLVTGFLGSYTTVSSFSLQTLALVRERSRWRATGNVLLSVALCLGGIVCGYLAAGVALAAVP